MSTSPLTGSVRELTEEEVESFRLNGWAKLDRFIEPELASSLLEVAQSLMGKSGTNHKPRPNVDGDISWWSDYQVPAREEIEPYASFALSKAIGFAAHRLMDRNIGVRYWRDMIAARAPVDSTQKNSPTPAHQDFPSQSFDRVGAVNFWVALAEVSPEQGSMRFYSRSHREGPLGLRGAGERKDSVLDLFTLYPGLSDRCPVSPPLHLNPGDATCHSGLTIHEAPVNTTDRTRWSWVGVYFPEDALYIGTPTAAELEGGAVKYGRLYDHPNYPVIWRPE